METLARKRGMVESKCCSAADKAAQQEAHIIRLCKERVDLYAEIEQLKSMLTDNAKKNSIAA